MGIDSYFNVLVYKLLMRPLRNERKLKQKYISKAHLLLYKLHCTLYGLVIAHTPLLGSNKLD